MAQDFNGMNVKLCVVLYYRRKTKIIMGGLSLSINSIQEGINIIGYGKIKNGYSLIILCFTVFYEINVSCLTVFVC